ncbi:MAG: dinitrogenase iron-molybdenum cofactor biosynthesis protein [Ruminococcaceae bacterium]|nr:dinitrogenase iron-molybdenum cofactor biosynthesis protein [Oscillospiraceae bacterium]
MKIAATYENGEVFQHFGHTAQFKLYEIEDGKIVNAEVVDTNGSGHGALAGLLAALNADVLICGGIGGGAQMALAQAGIKLFGGVHGDADLAVKAFLANCLNYDPEAKCNHHGHHHVEGHNCGDHGCGSNCGSNSCH